MKSDNGLVVETESSQRAEVRGGAAGGLRRVTAVCRSAEHSLTTHHGGCLLADLDHSSVKYCRNIGDGLEKYAFLTQRNILSQYIMVGVTWWIWITLHGTFSHNSWWMSPGGSGSLFSRNIGDGFNKYAFLTQRNVFSQLMVGVPCTNIGDGLEKYAFLTQRNILSQYIMVGVTWQIWITLHGTFSHNTSWWVSPGGSGSPFSSNVGDEFNKYAFLTQWNILSQHIMVGVTWRIWITLQ
ncbi:hypothetical protein J6590_055270 [Homalodisca vitripennis]|nr:hypothetical protein J6590_055270 [Homalodisca vitripennis]